MKQWLAQLTLRERYALLLAGLALGAGLGYFLLWLPLITAQQQLNTIVTTQQATVHWMQQAALEVKQHQTHANSETPAPSLLSLIDESMRQSALSKRLKRIEPHNEDSVAVSFEQIRFSELITWLGQLYNHYHIDVRTLSLERQYPDTVKVRLTLHR
ncbi:MAG: type II secretion system protein GspM [Pseudomonadota bacterium]|nr:type II secretion system protein GspM [Pseudomonadota bacterium]